MPDVTPSALEHAELPSRLCKQSYRKLRFLMKRDQLSWPAFLRRAIDAYDLMYSRTE